MTRATTATSREHPRNSRPKLVRAGDSIRSEGPIPRSARRALLVLGVHRSGTSALTGVLGLCGAQLPRHLMPATHSNLTGYFESQHIHNLHELLLAEAGTSWSDLAPFPHDWLDSPLAESWVERMAKEVSEEFGTSPLFVVKDPRICRLVPFWVRVLERVPAKPSFVIPIRDPLEVARSIAHAQGVEESKGLLLWLTHFLAAERETRGHSRSFVTYDGLLSDWHAVVEKISRDVDLAFPRLGRRAAAEIEDFLDRSQRHQQVDPDEIFLRHDVVGWVKQVFEWARDTSAGRRPARAVLEVVDKSFRAAEEAFGPLLARADQAVAKSREEAQRLDVELGQLREADFERKLGIGRLEKELETARSQIRVQDEQIVRSREHLALRETEVSQLIEGIKTIVHSAANLAQAPPADPRDLEVIDREIDSAKPTLIPQIAAAGLEFSRRSAQTAAQLQRMRTELDHVHDELARSERETVRLRDKIEGLDRRAGGLSKELSEQLRFADNLRAQSVDDRAEISERDAYIRRIQERLAEIESSLSWRATRLFRLLRKGAAELLRN